MKIHSEKFSILGFTFLIAIFFISALCITNVCHAQIPFSHQIQMPTGNATFPSITVNGDSDTGIFGDGAGSLGLLNDGVLGIYLNDSGDVGVGLGNPDAKLDIQGIPFVPSTSGSTPDAMLRIGNQYLGPVVDFGIGDNSIGWAGWIQTRHDANFSVTYPLLLNPNGGNVGIGTTNPSIGRLVVVTPGVNNSNEIGLHIGHGDGTWAIGQKTYLTFGQGATLSGVGSRIGNSYEGVNNNDLVFETGTFGTPNEKMRITSTGNVGIGVTTPLAGRLVVVTPGVNNANEIGLHVGHGDGTWAIGQKTYLTFGQGATLSGVGSRIGNSYEGSNKNDLVFETGTFASPNEKMRITGGGNVGIGTVSPEIKLDVAGSIQGTSITATTGMEAPYYTTTSTAKIKRNIRSLDGEEITEFTRKKEPVIRTYQFDPEASRPKLKQFEDITETVDGQTTSKSAEEQYQQALAEWDVNPQSIHYTRQRKGFIVEEMPEELLSDDGHGWDNQAMIVHLLQRIQALETQNQENVKIIAELKEELLNRKSGN